MERRPVIIVGSGPAGTATALALHRRDPALAREVAGPREGAPSAAEGVRRRPDPAPAGVPARARRAARACRTSPSHRAQVDDADAPRVGARRRDLCYVVRRDEFDAALVDACARARHRDPRGASRCRAWSATATASASTTGRDTYARAARHRRRRLRQPGAPRAWSTTAARRIARADHVRRAGRRARAGTGFAQRALRLRLPHPAPRPARLPVGVPLPDRRRAARQRRRLRADAGRARRSTTR